MPDYELNWGTIRTCSFAELFDVAARSDFALITVTYWMYEKALAEGATEADLAVRARDSGVRVGYLDGAIRGLPGVPDTAGALAESTEQAFRFAETFGVTKLNLTHFTGSPEVDLRELADTVRAVAARAAEENISLVFEFIPGTGVPDLATGVRLVELVDADNVSLLFDTWHHWRSGGRMADLHELAPNMIGAIQVSDLPADRIDTFRADDPEAIERNARLYRPMTGRLLPGDGVLPWPQLAAWFGSELPHLPIGAEIFNEDLDAMAPEDAARATHDALRRVLDYSNPE